MLSRSGVVAALVVAACIGSPTLLSAQHLELRATLPNPAPSTLGFGYSVAAHGDTVAIGAPLIHQNGIQRGAVGIYVRTGSAWTLQQTLTRPEGLGFGGTVALSGDTLITARLAYSGGGSNIYVYVRSGSTWTLEGELVSSAGVATAQRVAVDGNSALVAYNTGGAYVFERSGTTWSQQQRLVPEAGPGLQAGDGGIDLSGDTAIVGVPRETVGANANAGATYVFVRSGSTWTQQARLVSPSPRQSGFFGQVLSLSGDELVIGPGGGGYRLVRAGSSWAPQPSFDAPPPSHPASPAMELSNVVIDNDTAVISFREGGEAPARSWIYTRLSGRWARVEPATVALGTVALSGTTVVSGSPYDGSDPNQNAFYYPGPGIARVYAVAAPATPAAPTLTASVSGTTVHLSWTAAPGAISYMVEAGTSAGSSNAYNGNVGAVTQLTTPAPNGTYYVRVRGVNALGIGAPSAERVVSVAGPTAPAAPTLTASSTGSTLSLSWTAVASATSYVVDAGSAPGATNVYSGNVGAATQLSAAVNSGTYYIRIRAANAAGLGAASNEVAVTVTSTCTPPEVVERLSVLINGAQVTLSWVPPAGATGYVLDVGTRAGFSDLGRFEVTAPTLTTPAPAGGYYARVRSRNACGLSLESEDMAVPVGEANMVPQANPDAAETRPGTAIRIPVTDNDIDPDADDLAVRITIPPGGGTAVPDVTGDVLYSPRAGFVGVDTFSYEINDGAGGVDATSATITVSAPGMSSPADDGSLDVRGTAAMSSPGAGYAQRVRSAIGTPSSCSAWQKPRGWPRRSTCRAAARNRHFAIWSAFPTTTPGLGSGPGGLPARSTECARRTARSTGSIASWSRGRCEVHGDEGRCIALVYDGRRFPFRSVSIRMPFVEGLGPIAGGIRINDGWKVKSERDGEDWVWAECRVDGAGTIPWMWYEP